MITITYELSLAGQRASLLVGGNGHLEQAVRVPATPELLALARIDEAGQATYELSCWGHGAQARRRTQYEAPLTPEVAAAAVLAEEVARAEAAVAEDNRAAAEKVASLATARAEETATRKAAAAAAKIAERDAWIVAHGSDRLKKGLAAGLIDKMAGAYRSERITVDLGDTWFSWDEVVETVERDRLNPPEAEIDAFLETRLKWPATELEIQLRSVSRELTEEEYTGEQQKKSWRPALMMRLPWEIDRWAVRFLDHAK